MAKSDGKERTATASSQARIFMLTGSLDFPQGYTRRACSVHARDHEGGQRERQRLPTARTDS